MATLIVENNNLYKPYCLFKNALSVIFQNYRNVKQAFEIKLKYFQIEEY